MIVVYYVTYKKTGRINLNPADWPMGDFFLGDITGCCWIVPGTLAND